MSIWGISIVWRRFSLINEVLMVQDLLDGNGINKRCLYGHCYLLAKYWLQQGLEPLEVRKNIFAWACKYHLHLAADKLNVNRLIYKAESDKRRLREDVTVKVSQSDLDEITSRFDSARTRKVALAMLCYAKAAADQDNCFDLSIESFCNWLGCGRSVMYDDYLRELQVFGYIDRNEYKKTKRIFSWEKNVKSKSANFKLLVPFNNSGEYQLINNDIDALFDECFPSKNSGDKK